MEFPQVPTVHGSAPTHPNVWREPRTPEPFRTCSYCGSIHPGDLLAALDAGAVLGGSDWKYGWPHKFYLDVPNTVNPAELVEMGGTSRGFDEPCPKCCGADGKRRPDLTVAEAEACHCHGSLRRVEWTPRMAPRPTFHAKWYNEHIEDAGYDAEALAALLAALEVHSGVKFEFVAHNGPKVLRYVAPHHGYQR